MRKFIIQVSFISFVVISATAFGQTNKFTAGYEKGLTLVSMRGNTILNSLQKPKLSFSAGIFFQYNINNNFAFRTNLSFERKGCSYGRRNGYDSTGLPAIIQGGVRFDYLSLPLMARLIFGNKHRFFINAGPYIAYLIGQADKGRINEGPKTTEHNIDNFKKIETGICGGAGVELSLKKIVLAFEIRDELGLTNISRKPVINNGSIKTNVLNLVIAIHKK